jgi:S-adenosylmethionine:tRNA ribosyltransferase-isomerase
MYSLHDYDYELPDELVAQKPLPARDQSRLLSLDRHTGRRAHYKFQDLYDMLRPGDILVVNNTEVIPGRLLGTKTTGGKAELLIIDYAGRQKNSRRNGGIVCKCLIKSSKRSKLGTSLSFDKGLSAEVIDIKEGVFTVAFSCVDDFEDLLYEIGNIPLPPYIKRNGQSDISGNDRTAYQTVYACQKGAIAAPTAGLHFSDKFLEKLKIKGIQIAYITLHVGYGTFLPVRVSDIRHHKMHEEWYNVTPSVADSINRAKMAGGRVVAVGTTCVRTLEFTANDAGRIRAGYGNCDLFIYPGYRFKAVDAMLTNFHLPKSTLFMLVSAFAGRSAILDAYKDAIKEKYRFYSYGDAMFIA